jgi:hypothetical protein
MLVDVRSIIVTACMHGTRQRYFFQGNNHPYASQHGVAALYLLIIEGA